MYTEVVNLFYDNKITSLHEAFKLTIIIFKTEILLRDTVMILALSFSFQKKVLVFNCLITKLIASEY